MNTLNQIDISIIIPIYNVEKYLTVCIDSLMNQGDLRMEIILVNDGSTDLSGEIADEYAKKEERIKVIHQENGGASAARNVGLDIATGKYIAFLDSDDWIKDESLSLLYDEAVKYHADVVMGNMWLCHQDGSMDKPFKCISNGSIKELLSGKEGFIELVKTCFYLPTPVRYILRGNICIKYRLVLRKASCMRMNYGVPSSFAKRRGWLSPTLSFIITARTKNRSCIRQA